MSIATEITKLNTNLTASYTACNNKGATIPASQNFDNLATCISSIPSGTSATGVLETLIEDIIAGENPVSTTSLQSAETSIAAIIPYSISATKTITENGTYNSIDDDANGYSSVTVNVDTRNNTNITITPSTTSQTLSPSSPYTGYGTVKVSAVTASIDSDIVAGNIKSGVNILGVSGTVTELVGSTTTITTNGTYTPTNGSNGFTSVSVNVAGTTPSGTYTITANGTYDVTNYASANVNVSGGGGGGSIDWSQKEEYNIGIFNIVNLLDSNINGSSFFDAFSDLQYFSFPLLQSIEKVRTNYATSDIILGNSTKVNVITRFYAPNCTLYVPDDLVSDYEDDSLINVADILPISDLDPDLPLTSL